MKTSNFPLNNAQPLKILFLCNNQILSPVIKMQKELNAYRKNLPHAGTPKTYPQDLKLANKELLIKRWPTSKSENSWLRISSTTENSFKEPPSFRDEPENWDLNFFKASAISLKSNIPFVYTLKKIKQLSTWVHNNFKIIKEGKSNDWTRYIHLEILSSAYQL